MAARSVNPAPSHNATTLVTGLATTVVLLVGVLIVGGYWLQSQRVDEAQQRQQADIYQHYLRNTQPAPAPVAQPVRTPTPETQQARQYLLAHPAVTPGAAFDHPGVQATGHAIVRAIDQAKGL